MKVIFLEDVPNVAQAGDMKEVADGYGRNYLIPRKLALLAESQATTILEAQLKKKARLQAQTEAEMRALAQQLEGKEIILKARSGTKDRLYGSITSADIADELEKSTGLAVDKRKIELDEPIRQIGSHEIGIRLTKDIVPKIKLIVMVEEEEKEKEKKAEKKEKRAKVKGKTTAKKKETKGNEGTD
jgi:large subunit ribosomal protein L9